MKWATRACALSAVFAGTLAGCATYHEASLPNDADLLPSVTVAASAVERNRGQSHDIDPTAPLDEQGVVAIAVMNDPDLKAQRLKAGIADAQVFAAGLLPDPQVSVGLSRSSAHGGYDFGLAEELQSILTRNARRAAAGAQAHQVDLELLWQEWQVAEKARELFIQLSAGPESRELLTANRDVLAKRYERDRSAMLQNAATATTVAADATALAGIDAQLRDLALETNEADHALHALMGLRPEVRIRLGPPEITPVPTKPELDRLVAALPKRRPDLLALQAGYESQEAAVRSAVRAQFPAVSVGIDRARSAEEGVATAGLSISVNLPIFDRNRGRIAIERATREQLRAEYQARLDQAANDADRLWKSIQLLDGQRRQLEALVASLSQSAAAADRELQAGNLTLDEYANLRPNLYGQEVAAVRVRVELAQAQAALALIVGADATSR